MKIKKKLLKNISDSQHKQLVAAKEFDHSNGSDSVDGKTVIVGTKMDSESRELLTWALVKVAVPGDTVIALHVLPSVKDSTVSLLSLVKAFDSLLAVYDGFCDLKQIELKMKICRGSSISNVLVQEVNSYAAKCLVVGTRKKNRAIGYSPTSMARYCAKKLPQNCSVLAVDNGKIVFNKEAMPASETAEYQSGYNNSITVRSENMSLISKQFVRKSDSLALVMVKKAGISWNHKLSASCFSAPKEKELHYHEQAKTDSLALVLVKKPESSKRSLSQLFRETSEPKHGWPLLRDTVFSHGKAAAGERSKISVVQWAMQLPSRNSAASLVYPDQNSVKSQDEKAELDQETRAIVRVVNNASNPQLEVSEKEKMIYKILESLQHKYSSVCRLFTYDELVQITCNFSPENLVGKGGNSSVYKGCLSDGKELAVKISKPSANAMNEFVSEMEIITPLHHKNVIKLLGFCVNNHNLILVYDFLSRGSLEDNLHGENDGKNTMSWEQRYKVAVGVAEALYYLHGAENDKPVIHRDVKSSNILLDSNFEPQLSDFGFAKWTSDPTTESPCIDVAGTFGYLAPEYFMYGKVNEKTDVYAFGVVLLELLSGRKPVSKGCPRGQESLVFWATQVMRGGKVKQLLDTRLGSSYDMEQVERMTLAASLCIKRSPRFRPRIELVLKLLQGDDEALKRARGLSGSTKESDELSGDYAEAAARHSDIQSHINLALLDIDDDLLSESSNEPSVEFITANKSLEEYLQGRWSRSSSFA